MDAHGVEEAKSVDPVAMIEVGQAATILTKVEMDIVCSSEKLCNLNVLLMNVATRESDLEVSLSVKEEIPDEKALEFNLLCGILDAEVRELGSFFSSLSKEIVGVREVVLSSEGEGMGDAFKLFEEKLEDCEGTLKQSREQLDDMKKQSADLQKSLPFFLNREESDCAQDAHISGHNQYLGEKVQMQTGEQQRNVLRLLEKSLARELDLDMKLNEARQFEEDLKLKLHTSQQEASYLQEEAANIWAQCLEAENVAVVFMGIAKDLLSQLQVFHFKVNCLTQNRDHLNSSLEDLTAQSERKNAEINLLNSEVIRLEKGAEIFEGKLCDANRRAETAEAKRKLLEETNSKLNEELNRLKDTSSVEKESMEKQLKDLDLKLQHKLATVEASQENQTMMNYMVGDMENLIKDLKAKVLNAEYRADSAEAKCLVLSASNVELSEEVGYLRNRLDVLEAAVNKTNEMKIQSAENIEMRAKVITSLVMQLAMERDRLHEQLLSSAKENKALAVRLQTANKGQSGAVAPPIKQDCMGRSQSAHGSNFANTDKDCGEETIKLASRSAEMRNGTSISSSETEAGNARSISDLETVRTIDARALNIKHLIVAFVVIMISVAAYSFQNSNSPL